MSASEPEQGHTMDNEWAEQAKPGSWRGGPDEGDDELEVSGSRGLLCSRFLCSRSGHSKIGLGARACLPVCLCACLADVAVHRHLSCLPGCLPGCLHGLSWAVVLSVVYCLLSV